MKSRANWANRWMWQPVTLAFDWMGRNLIKILIASGAVMCALALGAYFYFMSKPVVHIVNTLSNTTETTTDIRNLAYAFATLIGILAILAAIPFQLIKVWINERTARTAEQGHITDRITAAVAGLGADKTVKQKDGTEVTQPNLEVRIGVIYALERIAQDSLRDHVQIMEILCAYIRENAPASGAVKRPKGVDIEEWIVNMPYPREDIQTALTVIGRRSKKQQQMEKDYRLDLRQTNVQRVDLQGMNFNKARFDTAHLEGADLWGARLEGADLWGAHLEKISVHQRDLSLTAGLKQEQIDGMFGDGSVKLPDEITRPSHWPKAELDIADFYKEWDKWKENPKAYTPPKE